MLKSLLSLIKKWKQSFGSITRDEASISIKMHKSLKSKSQSDKYASEISAFQQQSMEIINNHLDSTEYSKHRLLMKEIGFLIHYTFCVLKDDFYKGNQVLKGKITKIDDYVFSQYKNNSELESNIKKLTTLAFSNRFDEDPKENLLAYFVFIEETGFEIIMLLNDFYDMLANVKTKPRFKVGLRKAFSLDKTYAKEITQAPEGHELGRYETLMTQDMTKMVTPTKAKRKIIEDVLRNEKYEFKK